MELEKKSLKDHIKDYIVIKNRDEAIKYAYENYKNLISRSL